MSNNFAYLTANDLASNNGSFAFDGNYTLVQTVGGTTLNGSNNITGFDPLLGALANNGGPTETHELQLGSIAINGGDPVAVAGTGTVPLYDQRGAGFDRILGSALDIGALEVSAASADFVHDGLINGLDFLLGNVVQASCQEQSNQMVMRTMTAMWTQMTSRSGNLPMGKTELSTSIVAAYTSSQTSFEPLQATDEVAVELSVASTFNPILGSEAIATPSDRPVELATVHDNEATAATAQNGVLANL